MGKRRENGGMEGDGGVGKRREDRREWGRGRGRVGVSGNEGGTHTRAHMHIHAEEKTEIHIHENAHTSFLSY